MGVPCITTMGVHFASRVGASLLTAVGLSELITKDLEEYGGLAVSLAQQPEQLRSIRDKLKSTCLSFPLFDTARFTRQIEQAYSMMWKIYASGEKSRQIIVPEL